MTLMEEQQNTTAHNGQNKMKTKYTWWQDKEHYLGYLNDHPNYKTQGISKKELQENLKSLWEDIHSNEILYIKKEEELLVA